MCLKPLKGYISNTTGYIVKVANSRTAFVRMVNGDYKSFYDMNEFSEGDLKEYIDIPCRNCEECWQDTRRAWIARATAEMQMHEKAMFVTFTYRDYNDGVTRLPPVAEMITEDGEILEHQTLRYKDFQLFMKRLRKRFSDRNIRFMVCGEYGSHTFRPHYHAIIYGINISDFPDMIVHNKNKEGDCLYSSVMLDNLWSFGYTLSSDADNGTIAYVAGYVAKKFSSMKRKEFYDLTNVVAPFIRSSNRPGLGRLWFEQNKNDFMSEYDYKVIPAANMRSNPTSVYLPDSWKRAFRNSLHFVNTFEDIVAYDDERVERRVALFDTRDKLFDTDASREDRINSAKYNFRKSLEGKRGVY